MTLVTFQVATPLGPTERLGTLSGDATIVDLTAGPIPEAWYTMQDEIEGIGVLRNRVVR